jgi:hypothetical protein
MNEQPFQGSDGGASIHGSQECAAVANASIKLETVLAEVSEAVAAVQAARTRMEDARDRAGLAIAGLTRANRAAELPAPRALIRRLYWEHPEVRASDIAALAGLRGASEVHAVAGPGARMWRCSEPSCTVSELRETKIRSRQWLLPRDSLCEEHQLTRQRQAERQAREWREEQRREADHYEREREAGRVEVRYVYTYTDPDGRQRERYSDALDPEPESDDL